MIAMNNRFKIIKFEHGEAILYVNQHGYMHRVPAWIKVSSVEFPPEFYSDDNHIGKLLVADFKADVLSTTITEYL